MDFQKLTLERQPLEGALQLSNGARPTTRRRRCDGYGGIWEKVRHGGSHFRRSPGTLVATEGDVGIER
jgi:hypothetical protein